jgi:hypothetical protein
MKNKKNIWILVVILLCLPVLVYGLIYADSKLVSDRSYCVNRSLLLLKLPRNPITDSKSYTGSTEGVYDCAASNQPISAELAQDISDNYKYILDLEKPLKHKKENIAHLPDFSEKYLEETKEPWESKLEGGSELPEFSGECNTDKRKCAVVKFHIIRKAGVSYNAYLHYLILIKNVDGKYRAVAESFSASPMKG